MKVNHQNCCKLKQEGKCQSAQEKMQEKEIQGNILVLVNPHMTVKVNLKQGGRLFEVIRVQI
ncbi:MAG: hypothetical protein AAF512_07120 [Pseudomonadota bacterium]